MRRFVKDQPAGANAHRSPLLAMTPGNWEKIWPFRYCFLGTVDQTSTLVCRPCQAIDMGARKAGKAINYRTEWGCFLETAPTLIVGAGCQPLRTTSPNWSIKSSTSRRL